MKKYTNIYLTEQSLKAINENKLIFIDEIFAYTEFSQKLFYNRKLQNVQSLKDALSNNKLKMKIGLRKKWYLSENATVQIALYKLICEEIELMKLNNQDITSKGEKIDTKFEVEIVDGRKKDE